MTSPSPTPMPTAGAYIDDDLLAGLWSIASFVFILLGVRIAHVHIARKSMKRANYHSRNQWIASYILNSLSISTGFFTLVTIMSNIARFSIGSGNSREDGLESILNVLFFCSYALQNLSVSRTCIS